MISLVLQVIILHLAAQAPSAPSPEQAKVLLQQLADPDFSIREKAQAELERLGVVAEPVLIQGSMSKDPEVKDICLSLLDKVRVQIRKDRLMAFQNDKEDRLDPPLTGWKRFKAVVGAGGEPERKSFISIYSQGGSIIEDYERSLRDAASTTKLIDGLRVALLSPGKEADLIAEINSYLLMLGDPRTFLDDGVTSRLCGVLMILPNRQPLLTGLREQEMSRKLLRALLMERSKPTTLARVLQATLGLEMPEFRDWAIGLAKDPKQPGDIRGWAIQVFSAIRPKEAIAILDPMLADMTSIGTFKLGSSELKTELRDVALAALISASGQKPDQYPFPYFQAIPGFKGLPAPVKLGFPDAASREATFKKWRDFQPKPK